MRKFALIFLAFTIAFAGEKDFWSEQKTCYWETDCSQNKTKNKPKIVIEIAKINKLGDKYLNTLTPSEIRKLLKEVRDYAIMHPSNENLQALTKITDFIRRKSLQFMYAWVDYIRTHPRYDIQSKVGTTSWSYRYLMGGKEQYILTWLKKHSDSVGLYFVCDAKYSVCKEAAKAVKYLFRKGVPVVSIAVNCSKEFPNCVQKSASVIRKLGVEQIPAYVIFYKPTSGEKPIIRLIGTGLISADRLTFELFRNAMYIKTGQWIDFTQIPLTSLPEIEK